MHYYPADGWNKRDHQLEAHYAVPKEWINPAPAVKQHTRLEMIGTSLKEPDCPDDWCRAADSIKWSGPGKEGYWIAPNLERHPFHPNGKDEL